MLMQQVLRGIHQLSLASRPSTLSTGLKACVQCQSRSFHTTPSHHRNLDARAVPPSLDPSVRSNRWEPRKKMKQLYPEYTTKKLPFPKTGGRGPNGRIWNYARSGGVKRKFRMIDWDRQRVMQSGEVLEEKVESIQYDPNRSARIALVASREEKRYIIATQNMKKGDIIRTGERGSKAAARAQEGDCFPLGSLQVGTLVNCVQRLPGEEARVASAAGVTAQLVRKMGDQVIVRMPSKREMIVSADCLATIGRVSNIDHNKRVIGKAGRNRWLGFKPSSGRWHRKDGRFGRKIRGIKRAVVYEEKPDPKFVNLKFSGSSYHESEKARPR